MLINILSSFRHLLRQHVFLWNRFFAVKFLRMDEDSFSVTSSDTRFKYFQHSYNMGYFAIRSTERTVELALADNWLEHHTEVWEIGAVTPYYWPGRVANVVDPSDQHPQVNHRKSLFDCDLSGKHILSISTIEHIGQTQYGLQEDRNAVQAFRKIAAEAASFLITFPVGWNSLLDDFVFAGCADQECTVRFLIRNRYELWNPATRHNARQPYGGKKPWANTVAILERGNVL